MTHPITEPNHSIREWLARANMNGIAPGSVDNWDELDEEKRDWYRAGVDAILAELENPSEGMLTAGRTTAFRAIFPQGTPFDEADCQAFVWQAYRDMIRHIRDGGK